MPAAEPSRPRASRMPWFTAYGNHDGLLQGNLARRPRWPTASPSAHARSSALPAGFTLADLLAGLGGDPSKFTQLINGPTRPVTAGPERRILTPHETVAEYFKTTGRPLGHGFTHGQPRARDGLLQRSCPARCAASCWTPSTRTATRRLARPAQLELARAAAEGKLDRPPRPHGRPRARGGTQPPHRDLQPPHDRHDGQRDDRRRRARRHGSRRRGGRSCCCTIPNVVALGQRPHPRQQRDRPSPCGRARRRREASGRSTPRRTSTFPSRRASSRSSTTTTGRCRSSARSSTHSAPLAAAGTASPLAPRRTVAGTGRQRLAGARRVPDAQGHDGRRGAASDRNVELLVRRPVRREPAPQGELAVDASIDARRHALDRRPESLILPAAHALIGPSSHG